MSKAVHQNREASNGFRTAPAAGAVPPSVLDLWPTLPGRDDACADALGRLLLAQPKLVNELHDLSTAAHHLRQGLTDALADEGGTGSPAGLWLAATTHVLESAGRRAEALRLCREVMPSLIATCSADPASLRLIERFLRKPGVTDPQSLALFLQLRSACLMAREQPGGDADLRGMALDAFITGRLEDAERIYRHLMARGFEPGGSRAHLARALIAMGREPEAAAIVREAWDYRDQEPIYVAGRIAFLQALLTALAGADASPPLRRLKGIIGHSDIAMDWTMAPVFERVAPRLADEQRELFSTLLDVLSSSRDGEELDALPAWRRIDEAQIGGT